MLVADGEPGFVIGLIDAESDLWETLRQARTAVVSLLGAPHQQLADAFGYVAPAPGGPFRLIDWTDTAWGPAPVGVSTWAGCTLVTPDPPEVGWALQVQLEIAHVELSRRRDPTPGPPPRPLHHPLLTRYVRSIEACSPRFFGRNGRMVGDMRATMIHAPVDIRLEDVPDPTIDGPTDALVRVIAACICGSDLWPYRGENESRRADAHRPRVRRHRRGGRRRRAHVRPGDFVIAPFVL